MTYILKTADGECAQIKMHENNPMLCAVDAYESSPIDTKLNIHPHATNQNQMAFMFSDTNGSYWVKVEENELKLEMMEEPQLSADYWFEKENLNGSEHYGLKTVAKNPQYIIITKTKKRKFVLHHSSDGCCRFFTEQIQQ